MTWLVIAAIVIGCLAVGTLQWKLSQLQPAWPGAIIPVLWVGAAVVVVATGGIRSVVDVVGLVVISVVLARLWHDGRQRVTGPTPSAQA